MKQDETIIYINTHIVVYLVFLLSLFDKNIKGKKRREQK